MSKGKSVHYTKEILKALLVGGAFLVSAGDPYGAMRESVHGRPRIPKKNIAPTFYYLKRKGFIEMRRDGHDIEIFLTKEGKKRAGKYQIDDLRITKPKKWDGKWRVVIFDIPSHSDTVRNVFRRKLKEFGFYQLQKSIWICPFECKEEIALLRVFLGADKREIQVLKVEKMEDDGFLRKIFRL
jgi:CRISPR-associated endonuclease Cas2